jgi:very-short-patch-repair endonuclease
MGWQCRDMDPAVACLRLSGIARSRELVGLGVSRRQLTAAVASGSLIRLHSGVYGHPSTDGRVLHAARHGGRLACTDALRWHGVWVLPDARLHVALPPDGHPAPHRCEEDVVLHWDACPPTVEWVVPVLTALGQLSRCGDEEQFLVALESALSRMLISRSECGELRAGLTTSRRAVMDFGRPSAESGLETLTRWRLSRRGIDCRQQVELPFVGRVDLVIGDRLIVELDGREHHSSEVAFALDRRRDAAATAQGFRTLRFSYAQVVHDWESVEAAVLAVVEEGLHETPAGRRFRSAQPSVRRLNPGRISDQRPGTPRSAR